MELNYNLSRIDLIKLIRFLTKKTDITKIYNNSISPVKEIIEPLLILTLYRLSLGFFLSFTLSDSLFTQIKESIKTLFFTIIPSTLKIAPFLVIFYIGIFIYSRTRILISSYSEIIKFKSEKVIINNKGIIKKSEFISTLIEWSIITDIVKYNAYIYFLDEGNNLLAVIPLNQVKNEEELMLHITKCCNIKVKEVH